MGKSNRKSRKRSKLYLLRLRVWLLKKTLLRFLSNSLALTIISMLMAAVVFGFGFLFINFSHQAMTTDEQSGLNNIPWVSIILITIGTGWLFLALKRIRTTVSNNQNRETDEPQPIKDWKARWIEPAKGPVGLVGIWIGVLSLFHLVMFLQWTDAWIGWLDNKGAFIVFNLCFLAAVCAPRQKFLGAKYVGVFFGMMAIISVLNVLPWGNWSETQSESQHQLGELVLAGQISEHDAVTQFTERQGRQITSDYTITVPPLPAGQYISIKVPSSGYIDWETNVAGIMASFNGQPEAEILPGVIDIYTGGPLRSFRVRSSTDSDIPLRIITTKDH